MSLKGLARMEEMDKRMDALQVEIDQLKEQMAEVGARIEANGLLLDTIAHDLAAELEEGDDEPGVDLAEELR